MGDTTRRTALLSALAAPLVGAAVLTRPAHAEAPAPAKPAFDPSTLNPWKAHAHQYTVVTADVAASLRFYGDVIGYEIVEQGTMSGKTPPIDGVRLAGRRYLFLRLAGAERGTIRLIEASPGAPPIRPADAKVWDSGFGKIELETRDVEESYERMIAAGFTTVTPPTYYRLHDILFLGRDSLTKLNLCSYVPNGPNGEQLYISEGIGNDYKFTTLHNHFTNLIVMNPDQDKLIAFYEAVFGIKEAYSYKLLHVPAINRLVGAPLSTKRKAGGLGLDVGIETAEWMPPQGVTAKVYPTALDRTGLAMFTIFVDDLKTVRARAKAAGATMVSGSVLPLLGGKQPGGFIIRGTAGELIEVVAR